MAYSHYDSKHVDLSYLSDEEVKFLRWMEAERNKRIVLQKAQKYFENGDKATVISRTSFKLDALANKYNQTHVRKWIEITAHTVERSGKVQFKCGGTTWEHNSVNYFTPEWNSGVFTDEFLTEHREMVIAILSKVWEKECDNLVKNLAMIVGRLDTMVNTRVGIRDLKTSPTCITIMKYLEQGRSDD